MEDAEVKMLTPFAAHSTPGIAGIMFLYLGLLGALITIIGYGLNLRQPENKRFLWAGRLGYALSALGGLGAFGVLCGLVYGRQYQYNYVFSHTGNDLHGWFRFAATWAGQEGSFLLWAAWTAVIGFLMIAKAGKYEARVMPFYVTILAFLCIILLKQSPYQIIPAPTAADLAANPDWHYPPVEGRGLNPSLVNYWMTIHPPTIFFGFASLAVPFCYALAALLWKDFEGWIPRVMPYALLSTATLGIGLFMGGYWAYETQGWHGFWAWDPVENASFFPWLAITALVHGSVVQKSRGGMARTNIFLGLFAFWLFLLGTFLTRSGALAAKDASGQLLSVHAFDNIGKSALSLMAAMLIGYGVLALGLWLWRIRSIPSKPSTGESILSRDFAFIIAVGTMVIACLIVMLGTTQPLFQGWMKMAPSAPKPSFYNKLMIPLTMIAAFSMGAVPWLAWRKTDPETFGKKLLIPWIAMVLFGAFMLMWVLNAERALATSMDMTSIEAQETMRAWISPQMQRLSVLTLASLGFLAMLSNAMLAYRVFRAKPLAAGGWLAHVGIGVMIIGVIVSNTYERTERFDVKQGEPALEKYGYKFEYEKMTGKARDDRPLNPEFILNNAVQLRVTPPNTDADTSSGEKTFLVSPRWFAYNLNTAKSEQEVERMRWPHIQKYLGHDLYVGFANDPQLAVSRIDMTPSSSKQMGDYNLFYMGPFGEPGKTMGAQVFAKAADGSVYLAQPTKLISEGMQDVGLTFRKVDVATGAMTKELLRFEDGTPAAIYLRSLNASTKVATLLVAVPGMPAQWTIPLEVTFKPWVNLVWIGVIIATLGSFLAMFRRAREARTISEEVRQPVQREVWETPEAGDEKPVNTVFPGTPVPTASTITQSTRSGRKRKLADPDVG